VDITGVSVCASINSVFNFHAWLALGSNGLSPCLCNDAFTTYLFMQ
ncbi:MAG: hypothetical protein ACI936_002527, partial [Paraglaciecola sp.]